jgi:hypothetical protein
VARVGINIASAKLGEQAAVVVATAAIMYGIVIDISGENSAALGGAGSHRWHVLTS